MINYEEEKGQQQIGKCPSCASDSYFLKEENCGGDITIIYYCTMCGYEWRIHR